MLCGRGARRAHFGTRAGRAPCGSTPIASRRRGGSRARRPRRRRVGSQSRRAGSHTPLHREGSGAPWRVSRNASDSEAQVRRKRTRTRQEQERQRQRDRNENENENENETGIRMRTREPLCRILCLRSADTVGRGAHRIAGRPPRSLPRAHAACGRARTCPRRNRTPPTAEWMRIISGVQTKQIQTKPPSSPQGNPAFFKDVWYPRFCRGTPGRKRCCGARGHRRGPGRCSGR